MRDVRLVGSGGLSLAAEEWGGRHGAPVLLLHGGGQSRHAWKGTAARLANEGYHVLALDARGHGDSDWSADGHYDMEDFAADVIEVRRTLDRPPAVVGASMGGMSALLAQATSEEQLFSAVVLVDVTPRLELGGVARIMGFMTAHPEGFPSLDAAADAIAAYNPNRARPTSSEGLTKVLVEGADGRWRWRWDPRFITARGARMVDDPDFAAERMAEMAAKLYAAARRLRVPTLLVRGAQSELVSDESVTEFLAAVPHAGFVDVSGAGHMVAGDDNDAFTTAVVDFLHDHVGATPAEDELLALRDRVAGALRRLGHAFVDRDADPALLRRIAGFAEAAAGELEDNERRDRLAEYLTNDRIRRLVTEGIYGVDVPEGADVAFNRNSLVGGPANPFGIAARYVRDGDEVVASVVLGSAFEGPPGRAHGGVVSALIDETMAALVAVLGVPAFTASLTLDYTGPTPLHTELEFRARLDARDGRKLSVRCVGAAANGDDDAHRPHPFVEAEATFIEIDLRRFAAQFGAEPEEEAP